MEQRLHELLISAEAGSLASCVASRETALRVFAELGAGPVAASEGPTRLGDGKMLLSATAIPRLAAAYAGAFMM